MGHILSKEKKFCFVHIPKNGGSTIRGTYRRFDDCGKKFVFEVIQHSELGKIALAHVPLWVIERYFPREFEIICSTWSCALVRDPVERFRSALAQRTRQFLGVRLGTLSKTQLSEQLDLVMAHLEAHPDLPQAEFCHFTRQSDYIHLDGQKVIDTVYPIAHMQDLLAKLSRRTGVTATKTNANQSEKASRGSISQSLRTGWKTVKPIVPSGVQNTVHRYFHPLVVRPITKVPLIVESDKTMAFVKDYYAADFDLFHGATSAFTPANPVLYR